MSVIVGATQRTVSVLEDACYVIHAAATAKLASRVHVVVDSVLKYAVDTPQETADTPCAGVLETPFDVPRAKRAVDPSIVTMQVCPSNLVGMLTSFQTWKTRKPPRPPILTRCGLTRKRSMPLVSYLSKSGQSTKSGMQVHPCPRSLLRLTRSPSSKE